jgi:hypothetical protein
MMQSLIDEDNFNLNCHSGGILFMTNNFFELKKDSSGMKLSFSFANINKRQK